MTAASILRDARLQAGFSQRELGRRAGAPQATVARIEEGQTSPRFETLERLLAACGFELAARPRVRRARRRS
jgi:transcriptional regulator with XRE-family HTH domain